jgi:hypothetical protein
MSIRDLSFTDPQLSKRLLLGAMLAMAAAPAAASLDLWRAATGPRFQVVRGTEYDVWVGAAATGAAVALACVLGSALGRSWRRRPAAAVLAAACGLLLSGAQSIAEAPRGAAPYRVDWPMALFTAGLCGAIVAWKHPKFARDFANAAADARILARGKRIARGQRRPAA